MWLRNSNISERIQENELFTSYVPGLQDVGSYGNRASVHFFFSSWAWLQISTTALQKLQSHRETG